jgi:hypothetical protein
MAKEIMIKKVFSSLSMWILFFGLFFSPSAFAAEVSMFGGGEIDTRGQGFSYLGFDVTQDIGKGFALSARVTPNYLTYKYRSGNELIRAHSPGVYTVGGIKLSWDKATIGLFGGTEYRYTNLSPDVRSAEVRGSTFAGLLQGEVYYQLFRFTDLSLFGSYSGTDGFFYERAKIKRQITNLDYKKQNTINIGLEQFYGRNPDFNMIGGGPCLELYHIPWKFAFILRVGYKHDSNFGNGAYGGIELYKGF